MNDNEKNLDQTTDEVEGHAARVKGLVEDENTEGHGYRFKGALPEEGDDEGTEGHASRGKV